MTSVAPKVQHAELLLSENQAQVLHDALFIYDMVTKAKVGLFNTMIKEGHLSQGPLTNPEGQREGSAITPEQQERLRVMAKCLHSQLGYAGEVDEAYVPEFVYQYDFRNKELLVPAMTTGLSIVLASPGCMGVISRNEDQSEVLRFAPALMEGDKVGIYLPLHMFQILKSALDMKFRLQMGQLDYFAEWLVEGYVPLGEGFKKSNGLTDDEESHAYLARDAVTYLLHQMKAQIGYGPHGSWGVGSTGRGIHPSTGVAYEIYKVISKAIAVHRDPNPTFRGVDYDGVGPRYSQEPLAVVEISK